MENKDCPCKRKSCPRHGDCEACKAFHADSKIALPCERKKQKVKKPAGQSRA